jgi:hypothetical protein
LRKPFSAPRGMPPTSDSEKTRKAGADSRGTSPPRVGPVWLASTRRPGTPRNGHAGRDGRVRRGPRRLTHVPLGEGAHRHRAAHWRTPNTGATAWQRRTRHLISITGRMVRETFSEIGTTGWTLS